MLLERQFAGKPLNATLVYFSRYENIAFKNEFDTLAARHPKFKIEYVIGQPITADTITEHAPASEDQTYYLSGPEPMVDAVGDELTKRGLTLKQDWFPGYDIQTM